MTHRPPLIFGDATAGPGTQSMGSIGLRWSNALLVLCCLAATCYFLLSTTLSVWHFGWTEMFQDQFRQYAKLLQLPFPANLFAPDNAHRQVLSNLIRLADIHWRQGDQDIGVATGLLMMWTALFSIGLIIWRSKTHSLSFRCAASLMATIGLFWMGLARMQFHGNESVQIYFVITCALWVVILVESLRNQPSWRTAAAAILVATLAMFTFATGVAVFGLLVAMLFVRRFAWRWTLPIAMLSMCAVLTYLFVFPSGDGVRGSLHFSPTALLTNTTTWLSSFWLSSWLSHAGQSLLGTNAEQISAQTFGSGLTTSAHLVSTAFGNPPLLKLGSAIGSLGALLVLPLAWRVWWNPTKTNPLEVLGLALCVFTMGIGVLVSLGRANLFLEFPLQMVAERYLVWSTLFWLGLALGYASRMPQTRWHSIPVAAMALLIFFLVYPVHQIGRGWAAAVERVVESRAAQMQTGVFVDGILFDTDMPDQAALDSVLRVLLAHEVGPFRTPRSRLMGKSLAMEASDPSNSNLVYLDPPRRVVEEIESGAAGWHVSGHIAANLKRRAGDGLLILNQQNVVAGSGEFGYGLGRRNVFRRIDHVCNGFDAYFRADAGESGLKLYLVDASGTSLTYLGHLPDLNASP